MAIPLSSGYLSEDLQPLRKLVSDATRAARRAGAWGRVPIEGLEGLRGWLAREPGGGSGQGTCWSTPGGRRRSIRRFARSRPPARRS